MIRKIECLQLMDAIKYNDNYYLLDQENNSPLALKCFFKNAGRFVNGFARVTLIDGRIGYINKKGELVKELSEIEDGYNFNDKRAIIISKYSPKGLVKSFEIVDESFKPIKDFDNTPYALFSTHYSEGLLIVNERIEVDNPFGPENKLGFDLKDFVFIDVNGKTAFRLDSKIYRISRRNNYFSDGLLLINKNNHYVYINSKGEEVISLHHSINNATPFVNGVAEITKSDNSIYYINKNGEVLAELPSQEIIDGINATKYSNRFDKAITDLRKDGYKVENKSGSFSTAFGTNSYPRENPITIKKDGEELVFDLVFEEILEYNDNCILMRLAYGYRCFVTLDGEIIGAPSNLYNVENPGCKKLYGIKSAVAENYWFDSEEERDAFAVKLEATMKIVKDELKKTPTGQINSSTHIRKRR